MVRKGCLTEDRKKVAIRRLRAIGGQVRGLEKMIEADRYCLDILTQISAVQEAIRNVAKIIIRNYLEICAASAIQSKKPKVYDDLMDVIYKYVK